MVPKPNLNCIAKDFLCDGTVFLIVIISKEIYILFKLVATFWICVLRQLNLKPNKIIQMLCNKQRWMASQFYLHAKCEDEGIAFAFSKHNLNIPKVDSERSSFIVSQKYRQFMLGPLDLFT